MLAISERESLLERRRTEQDDSLLWDKLTLAQKFAASSLIQFGYDLAFLRHSNIGSVAVLLCDGNVAVITGDGEIDTASNLNIRQ